MSAAPPRQSTDWAKAPAPRGSGGARKPDLVDADALGQLDLVELAPEQLLVRRIRGRRRGRPEGEPHASPPRLPAAARRGFGPCSSPPGMPSIRGEAIAFTARERAGALKAPAVFHRSKPQNPLKLGHRGVFVALAEVVEAGRFDDVGDVNEAADHSEGKPPRDRESDPILQCPPRSCRSATTDHGEKLCR